MKEQMLVEKISPTILINPEQGRAYLKSALAQNDEKILLQALHDIIDSLLESELDFGYEAS
ncbi:MAG: hypothetical protein AAF383_28410 [Cyanobacteria bacterium P01_A01_bin.83]